MFSAAATAREFASEARGGTACGAEGAGRSSVDLVSSLESMAGILDTRQYLASRVMPAIFEALRALDAARPNDPLNFIATELESHSIQGMHNNERLPKAGGNADMFAYTNGVVRDALLQAIRNVAAQRPREPLKAIAEELRSLPAWSAANWSSQSKAGKSLRTRSATTVPAVQVPQRTGSSAEATPRPELPSSSQQLATHLERVDSDSDRRPSSPASSLLLRTPTRNEGRPVESLAVVDRGRLYPSSQPAPPASPNERSGDSDAAAPNASRRSSASILSSPAPSTSADLRTASQRGAPTMSSASAVPRVSLLDGESRRLPGRPKQSVLLR
eukprot:COSAG02_NODE_791_length_17158_cov_12.377396_12_plen_330_part_00